MPAPCIPISMVNLLFICLISSWRKKVPQKKMADDRAEAFARCLFGDIFRSLAIVARLNINIHPELEKERCAPEYFYFEIFEFSKTFINKLISEMAHMPVLLHSSEDFFTRFATSVCLKLSKDPDPDASFLKVTAFLVVLTTTSFIDRCYRSVDDIPGIMLKMLKDHLATRFYTENKFNEMVAKSKELEQDVKWKSNSVDEMRSYIAKVCKEELSLTTVSRTVFQPNTSNLTISEVRRQFKQPDSDIIRCKYCGMNCILLLKVFFQPRIMYKPEYQQM